MEYCSHNDPVLHRVDFVDRDIGGPRRGPFERARDATGSPHEWKRDQQFEAAEVSLSHGRRVGGTVLCDQSWILSRSAAARSSNTSLISRHERDARSARAPLHATAACDWCRSCVVEL